MNSIYKIFLILLVTLISLLALSVILPEPIYPSFSNTPKNVQTQIIFWQLRLPRVLLAFLVGATLAIGGVIFQALFRNPLASPYTLGVSSGAALGAALYIILVGQVFSTLEYSITLAAFIGALLSAGLIVLCITKAHLNANASILLGVILNLFFSSLILLLQYISDPSQLLQITRWLMGSISVVGWTELSLLSIILLFTWPILYLKSAQLDLISFGDDAALAQGVDLQLNYSVLISLTSLLIAIVVSITGPIGFIGIVVPHYMRLLGFRQHRLLLIAAFMTGGLFLAICDSIARTIVFPFELPVGVVTAILGTPLFLYMLLRGRGYN